ncbi:hydroxymethylpyrimidine/phosphomethylpyrimidine kinase [Nitrogeniibacter mangrovi]|uniref:Hydroxymethylpyrimidine/phosphomethylpyrimidine kinase n=1 Tax=Nitrogeniibacter mangrovi TaxID=2016596 RepID=A0A6C1AZW7_9RHOO|nr:bifunctional hydroxymethylpyrimidine kinase/phosphomethylpyrimidine kinase [Nitrogeniibacter mangrovi]QID16902.1 hydroxymethylpyrimidine/phosphomethylpyrimidine kinase [Nitrogeniibacter mangrovi]
MLQLPAVLSICAADPTSATGVAADAATLASMGVYPLCVVSEVCLRDTAQVEARMPLECELVVDQARVVLEDVPVGAIKITLPGSAVMVSALAELVADYDEVPLVLELPPLSRTEDEPDDAHLAAALELLLPYATTLVVDASAARRLVAAGMEEEEPELEDEDLAALLCGIGTGSVLVLGGARPGPQVVHVLYGEDGVLQRDVFERTDHPALGFGASASAALAAGLARGQDTPEATREALQYAHRADAAGLRMGMGVAVPDRLFWARNRESAA